VAAGLAASPVVPRGLQCRLRLTNRPENCRRRQRMPARPLEFGWYLPTHGDTTAYGVPQAQVPGSPELCDRVVQAAEAAGFEYLLIPVGSVCWEAWITG